MHKPDYYFSSQNKLSFLANVNREPHCLFNSTFSDSFAVEHFTTDTSSSQLHDCATSIWNWPLPALLTFLQSLGSIQQHMSPPQYTRLSETITRPVLCLPACPSFRETPLHLSQTVQWPPSWLSEQLPLPFHSSDPNRARGVDHTFPQWQLVTQPQSYLPARPSQSAPPNFATSSTPHPHYWLALWDNSITVPLLNTTHHILLLAA